MTTHEAIQDADTFARGRPYIKGTIECPRCHVMTLDFACNGRGQAYTGQCSNNCGIKWYIAELAPHHKTKSNLTSQVSLNL